MKYDPIKNPNYVATVIEVASLVDLEGLNNLKALQVFGMQALVGSDVQVGDVGVLFSTEVQLSEEFARENNLHRHTNLNVDPTKAGYLEDSRRVKAIKLRGHRSDSLFMPLSAFAYLNLPKGGEFNVGDVFDSINGHEILRKYQIKEPGVSNGPQAKVRRVDVKSFPLHIDSENYWRNSFKIPEDAPVVVTQKLHGTSVRYGKVPVMNDLPWYRKALDKVLRKNTTSFDYKFVVGSRMVVKSIDFEAESAGKQHFYAEDLWSRWAKEHNLDKLLPDGFIIYGELVGFTPDGAPIQKGYTYEAKPGEAELCVYRVAYALGNGQTIDLSWPQVKSFAAGIGLKTVPEFATMMHRDLDVDVYMDKRHYDLVTEEAAIEKAVYGEDWGGAMPVRLSDPKTVDEGVCVRYDGPNGIYILKAKSPIFLGHESNLLDEGVVDTESEESA